MKKKEEGHSEKLCPKFVGPFRITEVKPNHTYKLKRDGQESIQNEVRLKPFVECVEEAGQAPFIPKPVRHPNMKGARKLKKAPDLLFILEDFPLLIPNPKERQYTEQGASAKDVVEAIVQPEVLEERPRRSLKHYLVDYANK